MGMAKLGPLDLVVVATGLTLCTVITILCIKLAKKKKVKPCKAFKKKSFSFLHGVQNIQGISMSTLILKTLLLITYPN